MQAIRTQLPVAVVDEETARTQLQVFAPGLSDNPDSLPFLADVPIGDWQTIELFLPAVSGTLQIRPVDRPAVIEVRDISVRSRDGGIVWAAETLPELQALSVTGSLTILPGKEYCLFFSFGSDPIWVLPSLKEPAVAVNLKVVLCIHKDLKAVSEAIAATYAEIDRMTAQVRTASADRNKALRESQRQTEAIAAERDRALLQRGEQERLVQLANTRNAEMLAQKDALELELKALRAEQENLHQTLLSLEQSRSWRITRPLRSASFLTQKLKKKL